MSSTDIVPQNNFAQTGTVDWIQLGDSMVSLSYKALARMASYGVDSYTIILGMNACRKLSLGPRGEKYVRNAIASLTKCTSFHNALFFGFGIKSLPLLLGTHAEGLTLLALSAALSEVYHEHIVAMVLGEILIQQKITRETTPSMQNWLNLARACAGSLAMTSFGRVAETYMSLNDGQPALVPAYAPDEFNDSWRTQSAAKDIAKALLFLTKVSRGELESFKIVGGGDIGFLAAVADRLFDLNIIIKGSDGKVRGLNQLPGSVFQVEFVFEDPKQPEDKDTAASSRSTELQSFKYPEKTFRLQSLSDVIFTEYSHSISEEIQVSGRLDWENCLSCAFGTAFSKLLNLGLTFATALGCAARIFKAVADAESDIDSKTRMNWLYYADAGSGHGYVANLLQLFPELDTLKGHIQEATEFSYLDAISSYQTSIFVLAKQCKCACCTLNGQEQPPTRFCLVVVLETILKAGLIFSNVTIELGLRPKRAGFERLYSRQAASRSSHTATRERMEERYGPIVWVIEPDRENKNLYNIEARMRLMIDGALGLFTCLQEIKSPTTCAIASGGVCAFRKVLQDLGGKDGSEYSFGRWHIVPGRIESDGLAYDYVDDWYQDSVGDFFNDKQDVDATQLNFRDLSLHIEQKVDRLGINYQLSNSEKHIIRIMPAFLDHIALESYGLLNCHNQQHRCTDPPSSHDDVEFSVFPYHQQKIFLYQAPNKRSLCAMLTLIGLLKGDWDSEIVDEKCWQCVVDRAITQFPPRPRFSSRYVIIRMKGY